MTAKPFRPMLSGNALEATLRFPLLGSPKLDGIRCLAMGGRAMSRSMKPLPNRCIQTTFALYAHGLEGLDGEIVVGLETAPDVYRVTSSGVMSEDGEPDFIFRVFDRWDSKEGFTHRLQSAVEQAARLRLPWVRVVDHEQLRDDVDLDAFEEQTLTFGYEGVMLRSVDGPYKQGRSTEKEGWLLKLKRFTDDEGVIVGYEERMHNANEATVDERGFTKRSSHQANKVGMDTLGKFLVHRPSDPEDVIIKVSTGKFRADECAAIWANRPAHLGRFLKFKHFEHGVKDAPRHAVALGFRDPIDMEAAA